MFELTNKIALVTGARRGMGKAHALMLAKQGAKVVVTDIDLAECQSVVAEIQALAFKLDVSNSQEVEHVFDTVIEKYGRFDILVNNAGIFNSKNIFDMSEQDWNTVLDINLKGQFLCAKRAAKEMAKNNWGRIINITSIASDGVGVGFAGSAHYTASKGGIIGMTETMASEWASHGITVNTVAPGAVDTPIADAAGMLSDQSKTFIQSHVPLKRMGTSEEVSAAVIFLASEEASYITGITLYVDGGWLAT